MSCWASCGHFRELLYQVLAVFPVLAIPFCWAGLRMASSGGWSSF